MSKTTRLWMLFAASLVLALAAIVGLLSLDTDDEPGSENAAWVAATGTLNVTAGEVTLTTGTESQTLAAGQRVDVRPGDRIEVSDDGEAVLTLFTGQQSRLARGTTATLAALEQSGERTNVRLEIAVGQAINSVQSLLGDGSNFEIDTPNATITVRGTEFLVAVRPDTLTQVASTEGTVTVTSGDKTVEIPYGYGVPVRPDGMGDVKVWGLAKLALTLPEEVSGPPAMPVIFTNTTNGQVFYFHTTDLMTLPLGTHDLIINSPGPVRLSDITFPEDTSPDDLATLPVTFSAAAIALVDDQGSPVEVDDRLLVTLKQGDLVGHAEAAPGEMLLVGPGDWDVTVALASAPQKTQHLKVTMQEGESATATVPLSGFAGR